MFVAGLLVFSALAVLLARAQRNLEDRYCMADCCEPTSYDPSTNGLCWDCRGTGHVHGIAENGKVL